MDNNKTDLIFVLQHGNNGAPGDWVYIYEALQKQFAKENPFIVRKGIAHNWLLIWLYFMQMTNYSVNIFGSRLMRLTKLQ